MKRIDKLKKLLKEYVDKKNVLDNEMSNISNAIKEYCIKERKLIEKEYDSLCIFIFENWSLISKYMCNYNDNCCLTMSDENIKFCMYNDKIVEIIPSYSLHRYWNNDSYNNYNEFGGDVCIRYTSCNLNEKSCKYWIQYKEFLDMQKRMLTYMFNSISKIFKNMIYQENKNMKDIKDTLKIKEIIKQVLYDKSN